MIYYWIPFVLAFINCFITSKTANKYISWICIVGMFLLVCCRDSSVGTDSFRYAAGAEGSYFHINPTEYVNSFLMLWTSSNGYPYSYYFAIMALLTYVPIFYVLNNTTGSNLKYAVLLFIIGNNIYFLDSLNAIRQLAASSIMFLSAYLLYTFKKKVWGSVFSFILLLVAFGIHNTAIFYYPFFFLSKIKLNEKYVLVTLIGAVLFAFAFSSLIDVNDIFLQIQSFEGTFGSHDYSHYFQKDKYAFGFNMFGLIQLLLLPSFVCYLSFRSTRGNYFSTLYYWGIILLCLITPFTAIGVRAAQGLTFFELCAVPQAISKKFKPFIISYFLIYSLYFAYLLVVQYSDPEQLGPYKFYTSN